jgi:AraC family transcriptional regulator of adaptative response/methylated-DNA-[protein]-cysteine methyltransferase
MELATININDKESMYDLCLKKEKKYDNIFYMAVKTTGIFCKPTCTARKPKIENVEFFYSTRDALINGYRPCKLCKPLLKHEDIPLEIKNIITEVNRNPELRLKDYDIKNRGIDPNRLRRWFKKNHGMTFQAFVRTRRIDDAYEKIKKGLAVSDIAFDYGYDSLSGFNNSFKNIFGTSPSNSRKKNFIKVTQIKTPLGNMIAGATDDFLCLLEFIDRRMLETQLTKIKKYYNADIVHGKNEILEKVEIELNEYFEKKRKNFDIPLSYEGTDFQKSVWNSLLKIEYGKTASYKDIAEDIQNNNAVRAVGKANGDNRIAIIIPCHRVIGQTGQLTGYGGGLWRKEYLLKLEGSLE